MSQEILSDLDGQFEANYNRSTFLFRHGLAGHPLFELPSLIALAGRLENYHGCYWSNGPVGVNDGWEAGADRRRSLRETIEDIAVNDSLVMLKFVVHDPTAGPLFRDLLTTIVKLAGRKMAQDVQVGRATILIASPRRVTSYHVDSDVNFLFQVTGDKSFSVFDPSDRTLTSDEEVERYFAGDASAARFKPERQAEATEHDLRAGTGAHVPCLAPHWARTGAQVSIAVSCNFDLASMQRLGLVYKTNHRLRRLGVGPRSPRDRSWSNDAKAWGARAVLAMRDLFRERGRRHRDSAGIPVT